MRQGRRTFRSRAVSICLLSMPLYLGMLHEPAIADDAAAIASIGGNREIATFTQVPLTVPKLTINTEGARVLSEPVSSGAKITVSSNYPDNWSVLDGQIRQVSTSGMQTKGVSLKSSVEGVQIVTGGKMFRLPKGEIHNLKVENGTVSINGQVVQP